MLHALVCAALSLPAAPDRTPILEFSISPGFVAPRDAMASDCKVYADTVEIETFSQAGQTRVVKPFALSGDVQQLIEAAAQEGVAHHTGPVDGPTVRHRAYLVGRDGDVQEVDLGTLTDASITENRSLAASHLRAVLEVACVPYADAVSAPAQVPQPPSALPPTR